MAKVRASLDCGDTSAKRIGRDSKSYPGKAQSSKTAVQPVVDDKPVAGRELRTPKHAIVVPEAAEELLALNCRLDGVADVLGEIDDLEADAAHVLESALNMMGEISLGIKSLAERLRHCN